MLKTQKLEISHQTLITNAIDKLGYSLSDYSFANIYLFRNVHKYELIEDPLFIKGITRRDYKTFLMPLFPLNSIPPKDLLQYLRYADFFNPIPEECLSIFDRALFQYHYDIDDSDYLFSLSKMRSYPGRHLDGRRSLVNQLLRNHDVKSYPIDRSHISDCEKILNKWQMQNSLNKEATDFWECLEGLYLLEKIALSGRITYVDDSPEGFLLGLPLNDKNFTIHFAKGTKKVRGIYQYIFQDMAKNLVDPYAWINLEQDLGILSLRKAKEAYIPDRKLHKYRIMQNP